VRYRLKFLDEALKEWEKLDKPIREAFAKKLASRLDQPLISSARLGGPLHGLYKIKLASHGYRLIYQVLEVEVVVLVVSVGRREGHEVYTQAESRIKKTPPPK
jgi:mRNA interferase RelE/StbE